MKRILVVDDDKDLLIALKFYLQKNGYDVTTTTSCSDGLQIFHASRPDLLLLDINVGDEDGRSMCRQIKSQAELQHIPVIMISANHAELAFYRDYGANASLNKPFEPAALLELINNTISSGGITVD
jgi:DNA-binding response OmpR family regulator